MLFIIVHYITIINLLFMKIFCFPVFMIIFVVFQYKWTVPHGLWLKNKTSLMLYMKCVFILHCPNYILLSSCNPYFLSPVFCFFKALQSFLGCLDEFVFQDKRQRCDFLLAHGSPLNLFPQLQFLCHDPFKLWTIPFLLCPIGIFLENLKKNKAKDPGVGC